MFIKPDPGVAALRGSCRNSTLYYYPRGGKIIAASKTRPSNPRTRDQVLSRHNLAETTRQWGRITQAQRNAWDAYARQRYRRNAMEPRTLGVRGQDVFTRVNLTRLMLGMGFRDDAPLEDPPWRPEGIEALPATRPGEMRFRLRPDRCDTASLVLMKITPATATAARAPRPKDARCIRGIDPHSAVPCPATGGLIAFDDVRFAIEPGRRFGAVAILVRLSDGYPSDPCFADLVCPEPEASPAPPG